MFMPVVTLVTLVTPKIDPAEGRKKLEALKPPAPGPNVTLAVTVTVM